MGDRTVPFEEDEICDFCGKRGAFDFMGDLACGDCISTDEDGHVIIGPSESP